MWELPGRTPDLRVPPCAAAVAAELDEAQVLRPDQASPLLITAYTMRFLISRTFPGGVWVLSIVTVTTREQSAVCRPAAVGSLSSSSEPGA